MFEVGTLARLGAAVVLLGSHIAPAAADKLDGADLFKRACATCHASERNAAPRQGPNLFGIYGRRAGSAAGFPYSPGFQAGSKGVVWNATSLDRWLADPQAMMPGVVMPYKQSRSERRAAVIEYLKTLK
jgi:cytochrome c